MHSLIEANPAVPLSYEPDLPELFRHCLQVCRDLERAVTVAELAARMGHSPAVLGVVVAELADVDLVRLVRVPAWAEQLRAWATSVSSSSRTHGPVHTTRRVPTATRWPGPSAPTSTLSSKRAHTPPALSTVSSPAASRSCSSATRSPWGPSVRCTRTTCSPRERRKVMWCLPVSNQRNPPVWSAG